LVLVGVGLVAFVVIAVLILRYAKKKQDNSEYEFA